MLSDADWLAREPDEAGADLDATTDRAARRIPVKLLWLLMPASLVVGVGLGWFMSSLDDGNRIVIGNSGKTLSAVIQDDGALVVIGGGTSRTDLADIVDRSTLPWHRQVDLLILGTNGDQALGALGLIQRGGVSTVLVAGIPESEPVWDLVDHEAARHHVNVKYVDRAMRVQVTKKLTIDSVPVDPNSNKESTATLVRLRAGLLRFTWISGLSTDSRLTPGDPLYDLRSNVLIDADGGTIPTLSINPELSIQPGATRAGSVRTIPSRFTATLDSGDQLQLRFSENELRLPQDRVVDTETTSGH